MVVILMGVSGSGKTTLGLRLASDLGWAFIDADDYHSPRTIEKMARGEGIPDDDLQVWMASLRGQIVEVTAGGGNVILAYSALKSGIRDQLMNQLAVSPDSVRLVYLKGTVGLIRQRLRSRSGHFLRENLLVAQFASLEEPADAVTIDIDERPGRIVDRIRQALSL